MIKITPHGVMMIPEVGVDECVTPEKSRTSPSPVALRKLSLIQGPAILGVAAVMLLTYRILAESASPKAALLRHAMEGIGGIGGLLTSLGVWGEQRTWSRRLGSGILGALLVAQTPITGINLPGMTKKTTAAVAPAAAPAATKSSSASTLQGPAPVDFGDLRLRVLSAAFVSKSKTERPILMIELAVMNTNPIRKHDEFMFYGASCRLRDNFGNNYERISEPSSPLELVKGSLYPGETIVLPITFQPSIGLAKSLVLEIGGPEKGKSGERLNFEIPAELIRKANPAEAR